MEQNVTFKDAGDTKGITVVSNYADLRHALCSAQPMTICVDGYIDCGVNPVVLFPGQRIVGKIPGNKKRFPKSKPSGLLMRICGQAPAVLMAENSGLVDLTVKVMVSSSGVGDASKQRIISFDETAREAFWENVDVQFDASRREAKGSLNVIEIPRSLNELKLLGSCFIIDQTREFIGCGIQGHSGKSVLNVCGKLDIEMENGQEFSGEDVGCGLSMQSALRFDGLFTFYQRQQSCLFELLEVCLTAYFAVGNGRKFQNRHLGSDRCLRTSAGAFENTFDR